MAGDRSHTQEPLPGAPGIAAFHQALFDCEQMAIIFIDSCHRIISFNNLAKRGAPLLIGRALAVGEDFRIHIKSPEGLERYERACNGEPFTYEWEAELPGNETSNHLVRYNPVFDESGVQIGTCLVAFDQSGSQRRAQAEAANTERLLELVQNTGDILRVEDTEGVVTYISPAVVRVLGYSPSDIVGRAWSDFVHPDDKEESQSMRDGAFLDGKPARIEQRVMRADGLHIHLECLATKLASEGGTELVIASREVSDRVVAERDLRAARDKALEVARLKTEFLANVSHEIRTPMNAVIGMTELLLETNLDDEQTRYTNIVHQSAESLLSLINDILDFSKAESGKLQLVTTGIDLREIVEDVFEVLGESAGRKNLELLYWADLDFPRLLSGDADKLRRVLTNLVGNSVKFTDSGHVLVRLKSKKLSGDAWHAVVEVSDSGIGIPQDQHSQLFRAFSQIDGSATRKYGGTGLGLAICKQLVQLMGGKIGVESAAGKGSKFWFSFPLRREGVPAEAVPPIPSRIACVSPELSVGIALSRLLWEAGFQHVAVLDHEQASEEALSSADCVVVDIRGDLQTPTAVRSVGASGKPLIALCSFAGQVPDLPGVVANLRKPIRRAQLGSAVKGALGLAFGDAEAKAKCKNELTEAEIRLSEAYGQAEAADVLQLLVADIRNLVGNAAEGLAGCNASSLETIAARLVSGCSSVGAHRLQLLANEFAKVCASGDLNRSLQSLENFRTAFETAVENLPDKRDAA